MNEEAAFVMGVFTFRVFLVGAIMLAYPRIARKGLLFGTYLGEEQAAGPARRRLLRTWDMGTALIMLVALIVGWSIGFSGRWIPGNFIGTAVLVVPFVPLYFWMHGKVRGLAPAVAMEQAGRSAASLQVDEGHGGGFALFALVVCLVASTTLIGYALVSFRTMPGRIPTLANLWGYGDALTEKSLVSVLLIPAYNLVFAPFFAVMGLLVAQSKRSIRGGSEGGSTRAQDTFRVAVSHIFAAAGLFLCLFLAVASIDMIWIWQGRAESLSGIAIGGAAVATILVLGGGLFRIMWLGQGGARLETGSPDAPLTGGLADNARWILGVLYVDRTDPAIMVEARWGIGYTMNLGNRVAQVLLTVFAAALLGLALLTLAEIGVFA
jgi:uncharacterized membrane protein